MFDLSNILTSIISLGVFALVWIIGNKLKPWLKTVIPQNAYDFLCKIAKEAVFAVEAQFVGAGGVNKFNAAMERILDLLAKANLTFSQAAVTDAIESAWLQMVTAQQPMVVEIVEEIEVIEDEIEE